MIRLEHITEANAGLEIVRQLFLDYQQELNADLCFQSFEAELKDPLKKYGPPTGSLLLAYYQDQPAGCIALQPLPEAGVCEMKRLYVVPSFRKFGIGRKLVQAILDDAKALGYHIMKLDTLDRLQPAIQLYKAFGFTDASAYYANPLEGVVYMQRTC
ncbi:MAG: GNAT family N-acetyltransferase [Chitinophagaceae bacterium]|nr:GNAT family N-acetyltransferase [Chitinophagaceae bacterium]